MTQNEIIEELKKIIITINPKTDLSNVGPDTKLVTDLGINSLSMLLLALAIEEKMQVRFDNKEPFVTVGDVCQYIQKVKC